MLVNYESCSIFRTVKVLFYKFISVSWLTMDFFRNLFDHFRGSNTKREDENKYFPGLEDNDSQSSPEVIPRPEMDIELLPDFIDKIFERNRTNNNDMPGYHQRNFPHLFGDFSSFTEIFDHFEEALNEMGRHVFGSIEFEDFSGANSGDMRDAHGMFTESEKTLTGEKLRNYYLSSNTADTSQGGSQILEPNDKETHDNKANLFINNDNRSDFTLTPYFKSQSRYVTTKIGPDGIAEITTILKDDSGNEERIVRKVKLF